jgi:CRISPR/Cas system-associated endoribonuclease Cas2
MDYDRFDLLTFNRPINETRVRKLVSSIEEHGFQKEKSITVYEKNGKLVITDGQHRFTAKKRLGLPIHYIVKPQHLAVELIIDENNTQFKWAIKNYINFYANPDSPLFNEAYKFVADLADTYQITEDSVLNACRRVAKKMVGSKRTTYSGLQSDTIKRGKLELPHMSAEKIKGVLDNCKEIERVNARFRAFKNKTAFTNAMIDVVTNPRYKQSRMIKKLNDYSGELNSAGGKDKYKEQLSNIYNKSMGKAHRIDFFDGRVL